MDWVKHTVPGVKLLTKEQVTERLKPMCSKPFTLSMFTALDSSLSHGKGSHYFTALVSTGQENQHMGWSFEPIDQPAGIDQAFYDCKTNAFISNIAEVVNGTYFNHKAA